MSRINGLSCKAAFGLAVLSAMCALKWYSVESPLLAILIGAPARTGAFIGFAFGPVGFVAGPLLVAFVAWYCLVRSCLVFWFPGESRLHCGLLLVFAAIEWLATTTYRPMHYP